MLLLALSALFSGSEVALFSISAAEREELADDTQRATQRVLWLLERPRSLLISILMLNTVVNVGAAILASVLTLEAAEALGWSEIVLLVLNVVVLTFVLLVVSEITPKVTAARQPIAFARQASLLLYPLARLLYPISKVLAQAMLWLQTHLHRPAERLSTEDIKTMADVGEAHGTLEEDERALIHSILEFGETMVREVMVSRVDMIALPETATLEEALALIRKCGHSRVPLYRDHLDHILGVVYAKDLLPYLGNGLADAPVWEALARQPRFVPVSKTLDDMLTDFQEHNTHMAIVVDEYGGTAGLVTLEDLLEEVVGEIRDELDEPEESLVHPVAPDAWRADARIDLDDLADEIDTALATDEFDFETLGGLIFHLTGEVPQPGDEVTHGRLRLRVEEIDQNRIKQVLVTVLPEPEPKEEE
ncbi:MAG: HlyC/CorC family transporter [Rhodothermaceae bacterium]|nr:HlyC/CorC family transporter [Rhodothermaceae bacterium]